MRIKIIFEYEEIVEDVEKIVPDNNWTTTSIFTKDGLHCIPDYQIKAIEVLSDEKDN